MSSRSTALTFVLVLLGATWAVAQEPPRPNVVMIVLDDVGYGSLGAYGDEKAETPHLDRLAGDGMRFDRFYVNSPTCTPSRAALITGRYPHRFNLSKPIRANSTMGLPAKIHSLPTLLEQAGYRTIHLGKWHLGHARDESKPMAHGFAEAAVFRRDLPMRYLDPQLEFDDGTVRRIGGHVTEVLTDRAIEFLDRMRLEPTPFFLSLWHFAAHSPHHPPKGFAKRFPKTEIGRYRAVIAHTDQQIGRILDRLEENGQAKDTLVLVLSDNGSRKRLPGANGGLRGLKRTLFEGGIRTPLLVRWPGTIPANRTVVTPTFGFDLLPTIAEWADADLTDVELDGRSRAAEWTSDRPASGGGPVFFNGKPSNRKDLQTWAVLTDDWKLIFDGRRLRLFETQDLDDERQARDHAPSRPETVTELHDLYDAWRIATTEVQTKVDRNEGAVESPDGGWFRFGPAGGRVLLEGDPRLDFRDGDFSLTFRVRAGSWSPGDVLASRAGSWELRMGRKNRPVFELLPAGGARSLVLMGGAAAELSQDRWHRITVTILNTRLLRVHSKMFVDGVLAARRARPQFSVGSSVAPVVLGGREDGTGSFTGEIQELRLFIAPLDERQRSRLEE